MFDAAAAATGDEEDPSSSRAIYVWVTSIIFFIACGIVSMHFTINAVRSWLKRRRGASGGDGLNPRRRTPRASLDDEDRARAAADARDESLKELDQSWRRGTVFGLYVVQPSGSMSFGAVETDQHPDELVEDLHTNEGVEDAYVIEVDILARSAASGAGEREVGRQPEVMREVEMIPPSTPERGEEGEGEGYTRESSDDDHEIRSPFRSASVHVESEVEEQVRGLGLVTSFLRATSAPSAAQAAHSSSPAVNASETSSAFRHHSVTFQTDAMQEWLRNPPAGVDVIVAAQAANELERVASHSSLRYAADD